METTTDMPMYSLYQERRGFVVLLKKEQQINQGKEWLNTPTKDLEGL